jgi:RHS repeat-associated protein
MPYIRHLDWLGSARLSTTWSHTVQSKVAYAPFGETYNEAGASSNDRSFTGQEQDTVQGSAATGIYDFLFRKYDPAAGRWLSPDPYGWGAVSQGDPQSIDRYAYVTNRPMGLLDPFGLDDSDCGAEGAGGGVTTAGDCNGGLWDNSGGDGGWGGDYDSYYFGGPGLIPGPDTRTNVNPCDGAGDFSSACMQYQWNSRLQLQNQWCPGVCYSPPPITPTVGLPPIPAVTARTTPPLKKKSNSTFPQCMTGQLINNFAGSSDVAGVTIVVHVAALAGRQAAGGLLPGPGWLYTGAAVLWDGAQVAKAYASCKYDAGESVLGEED